MTHCPLCRRPTDPDDDYHSACAQQLDDVLATIPQLYADLSTVLAPSGGRGARVSESRTAPLPTRLEPLSLRANGGIISTLAGWEVHLRGARRLSDAPPYALDDASLRRIVAFLRAQLDWALTNYPAISLLADAARQIQREARMALGLGVRRLYIGDCPAGADSGQPCGQPLHVEPMQEIIACPRCHNAWPQDQWVSLGAKMAAVDEHAHRNAA